MQSACIVGLHHGKKGFLVRELRVLVSILANGSDARVSSAHRVTTGGHSHTWHLIPNTDRQKNYRHNSSLSCYQLLPVTAQGFRSPMVSLVWEPPIFELCYETPLISKYQLQGTVKQKKWRQADPYHQLYRQKHGPERQQDQLDPQELCQKKASIYCFRQKWVHLSWNVPALC